MADPSFCGVPIIIRDDMPVGCMVVVSNDGRQVIPIINLDIEVGGNLAPEPPRIEYGERMITGEVTCTFEDKELYAKCITGMNNVGRFAMEAIVKLGDQVARNGGLNRSGRKQWRKDRKRLVGNCRRTDARLFRQAYGRASF